MDRPPSPLHRAALLGLIQGVAEVVPVSSSAQLTLLPFLLGWPEPAHRTALHAGLHAGSCAGLVLALRRDLLALPRTASGRRTAVRVALATVPAVVAGATLAGPVEARLGRPGPTAALLGAAGVALWAAERRPQGVPAVGGRQALAAALAQVVALAPGVSRAGATLTALRLLGVERAAATRFSLLMSLPVTAGAAVLTLARADRGTLRQLAGPLGIGAPAAAVAAGLAHRALARAAASPGGGPRRAGGPATGAALYRLALAGAIAARLCRRTPPGAAS